MSGSQTPPPPAPALPGPLPAGPPPAGPPPAGPPPARWTPGRVASLTVGVAGALVAILLLAVGGGLLAVDRVARDESGFLSTDSFRVDTNGYALTSEPIDLDLDPVIQPRHVVGDLQVRVTADDPATAVFVGVAPSQDVDRYLRGVAHAVVIESGDGTEADPGLRDTDLDPRTLTRPGTVVPESPGGQPFWSHRISGTGTQTLTWTPQNGDWTVVVMRADGEPGVAVRADVGTDLPAFSWVGGTILTGGILFLVLSTVLIVVPVRRARRTVLPTS